MKDINARLMMIGIRPVYPTVFSDGSFTYYEQLCGLCKLITDLNAELEGWGEAIDGKQDKLTFDNSPTFGSGNPVTSNGVYVADNDLRNDYMQRIHDAIIAVNGNITETEQELLALINGKQDILTFDNSPTQGSNNPVTSAGIYTANRLLMETVNGYLAGKQDLLTFDNAPTENSDNPVTSDGIYYAIRTVQNALTAAINGKQNILTFDTAPTNGSSNPVTSDGVYDAIESAKASLAAILAPKVLYTQFGVNSSAWTNNNGTYTFAKTITGLKENAAIIVLNSNTDIAFTYTVSANTLTITTTNSAITSTNISSILVYIFNDASMVS